MKRRSILGVFLLIPLSLTGVYFTKPAHSQEMEVGDNPRPADGIREINFLLENLFENNSYDYDKRGPYLLAQAIVMPTGTPDPRPEEDVTDEEKQSFANLQYFCKVIGSNDCRSTGAQCGQFAQSPTLALACWDEFFDCVVSVKDKCESEHPVNSPIVQENGDSSSAG